MNIEEERLNTISHGIGVVFGSIGLIFLVLNRSVNKPYALLSIIIYGLSFILLFAASTSYHYVSDPVLKRKLRIFDHISIYLLIAGTYTPVALITLEAGNGWTIFYIVWSIAALGTLLKLFFTGKFETFSLLLYLVMGWLILLDVQNVIANIPMNGLVLLISGGVFYSLGIIFYAVEKIPFNHFIWHLFVLGGALSHFFLIYAYVI